MLLNADRNQRVIINSNQIPWVDSPMMGVQRRMLEREGDEVARATTIVITIELRSQTVKYFPEKTKFTRKSIYQSVLI